MSFVLLVHLLDWLKVVAIATVEEQQEGGGRGTPTALSPVRPRSTTTSLPLVPSTPPRQTTVSSPPHPPSSPCTLSSRRPRPRPSPGPTDRRFGPTAKRFRSQTQDIMSNGGASPVHNGVREKALPCNGTSDCCSGANICNGKSLMKGTGKYSNDELFNMELIRLMLQTLREFGFCDAAAALEEESGLQLENSTTAQLRQHILHGRWDDALVLLEVNDDVVAGKRATRNACFLVCRQRYLELVEAGDMTGALVCLRKQLARFATDVVEEHGELEKVSDVTSELVGMDQLHKLSALLMVIGDGAAIKRLVNWDGVIGGSRSVLLDQLRAFMPPGAIVPSGRLQTLVRQAVSSQVKTCVFHNKSLEGGISLLRDHICDRKEQLPLAIVHTFEQHEDEVWFLRFSHRGDRLASASKDKTVAIYDVSSLKCVHRLRGHNAAVSFLAWSPDDKQLLTCSNDNRIKLWDTFAGLCLRNFNKHTSGITACAWCPNGVRFVTAGNDQSIILWDIDGTVFRQWRGVRLDDMAITSDGSHLVVLCHDRCIRLFGLNDDQAMVPAEDTVQEIMAVTSLCISRDDCHVLVNSSNNEIHEWDIHRKSLTHVYRGQKQGRFVIRSCYGGIDEIFVVSGSEDCSVYIWHRSSEQLLETLTGHTSTVNHVSWNTAAPYLFASCSDDGTVCLWGVEARWPADRAALACASALNGASRSVNGNGNMDFDLVKMWAAGTSGRNQTDDHLNDVPDVTSGRYDREENSSPATVISAINSEDDDIGDNINEENMESMGESGDRSSENIIGVYLAAAV